MGSYRANSSPELLDQIQIPLEQSNQSTLEGNVKLLTRLIQDFAGADAGGRKAQCITEMMAVLGDMQSQVQKANVPRRREAELRRCNTDLRRGAPQRDRAKPLDPAASDTPDVQKLRRELFSSFNARRNQERMCASLSREKEFIATELARKVRELGEAEELVEDLRRQNSVLLEKLKACAPGENGDAGDGEARSHNSALQERNKALTEQLLRSVDAGRVMKRRLAEVQEENARVAEVTVAVAKSVGRIREKLNAGCAEVEEEVKSLDRVLIGLQGKLLKLHQRKGN
ncbi:hypothetical protein ZIOFF_067050 [Zingiber officinale]|uniref:Uncharacterized protein n=1 Tax=Zingiber officinale TaxID=94328 RepID=A0A8J5BJ72_ZINOF|nr:hypothetical protein ZIOFF_067050 [Zingiber officinale]